VKHIENGAAILPFEVLLVLCGVSLSQGLNYGGAKKYAAHYHFRRRMTCEQDEADVKSNKRQNHIRNNLV
jgi:hypothetical protein